MNPLFNSNTSTVPATDTKNASGGKAYKLSTQVALAKYAVTGTFNDTYQVGAAEQLDKVLKLCQESNPEFIAKLAVYARQHGHMKDTPAFMVAYLAKENINLCKQVFSRVIDDPKMLRNFVQVLRSGVVGRKSLGTAPKKLVQGFLNGLTDEQLFKADVGNTPSLPDIIKMMHPKPANKEREALYAYLIGKEPKKADKDYLLPLATQFEAFKKGDTKELPNVPFQMLTALSLTKEDWTKIAERASWTQTRMNLNTFARHGVFENPAMIDMVAARLANADLVRKSRVFPYQLFTTFMNVSEVDQKIKNALQAAAEISLENVPTINGEIYIALDTSGSMGHKITGNRGSATTKTRYIDVASLIVAAICRKNKNAVVVPFDTEVRKVDINPFDSIMTNAQKLADLKGGGTDCSVSLAHLNKINAKGSAVIYVSDNESWRAYTGKKYKGGTGMMEEWEKFAKRNPGSKLVNIDITPSDTTQVATTPNTLLVAGFSDFVFDVVADYFRGNTTDEHWLGMINEIKL
jgi:60 kDa SS-A/Ro ribonucleoprotein